MMTLAAIDELNTCLTLAAQVGCDQDQMSRFIRAGYIPQPRQLEFHALARLADSPEGPDRIGFGGTRGQAKSHCILAQAVIGDMSRRKELKGLYLRKVQKRAGESFEDLRRKVLMGIPHKSVQGKLSLPNGSFIILGGFKNESEIDSYLGLEYDFIILEDATTLSKTKYDAIRGALRTSRNDWRPRLYASANPGGVGHRWFADEFIDDDSPATAFVHTTMGDNLFINPEYEQYLNGLSGFLRRAWRDGDFAVAAGQFFTAWDEDVHVIEPFDIPKDWYFIGGLDYGWKHPTVFYVLTKDGDGNVYVIGEHYAARTPVESHAKAIKLLLNDLGLQVADLQKIVAGSDAFTESRRDGGTIARDYDNLGVHLTMANTARVQGAREITKRLGSSEQGIEPSLFIFDTCPRLIWTIPQMIHDPQRQEDVLKFDADDSGDNGDDPYDGARYPLLELASVLTGELMF